VAGILADRHNYSHAGLVVLRAGGHGVTPLAQRPGGMQLADAVRAHRFEKTRGDCQRIVRNDAAHHP
jgi:hypothetical protein